jgi:hypothetical protein
VDGKCDDGPHSKIGSGGTDRLDTHGQGKSWVKIDWYYFARKMREQDNILHRRAHVNLIDGTSRLARAAGSG